MTQASEKSIKMLKLQLQNIDPSQLEDLKSFIDDLTATKSPKIEDPWLVGCARRSPNGPPEAALAVLGKEDKRERSWERQVVMVEAKLAGECAVVQSSGTLIRNLDESDSKYGSDCRWVLVAASAVCHWDDGYQLYDEYRIRLLRNIKKGINFKKFAPSINAAQKDKRFRDLIITSEDVYVYEKYEGLFHRGKDIALIRLQDTIYTKTFPIKVWEKQRKPHHFQITEFPIEKPCVQYTTHHKTNQTEIFGMQHFVQRKDGFFIARYLSQTSNIGGPFVVEGDLAGVHVVGGLERVHIATMFTDDIIDWIIKVQRRYGKEIKVHDMFQACRQNRLENLKDFLKGGISINNLDPSGRSSLHYAASKGQADITKFLLSNDADINLKDSKGANPFHQAAFSGHVQTLEILLQANADPNVVSKFGRSALHYSCMNGHVGCVRKLIEWKGDLNLKDGGGQNCLLLADDLEVVKLLIEHKIPVDCQRPNNGPTRLGVAAEFGELDIVRALLENDAKVNHQDGRGYNAFHHACEHGHPKILELLIEAGAQVNSTNALKQTGVHIAALSGQISVLKTLAENQADLDAREKQGFCALHIAAQKNFPSVAGVLCELGASKNMKCKFGWSAMHWSAHRGFSRVVQVLLEYGARLNEKDPKGRYPAKLASAKGHKAVVQHIHKVYKQNKEKKKKDADEQKKPRIAELKRQPSSSEAPEEQNLESPRTKALGSIWDGFGDSADSTFEKMVSPPEPDYGDIGEQAGEGCAEGEQIVEGEEDCECLSQHL